MRVHDLPTVIKLLGVHAGATGARDRQPVLARDRSFVVGGTGARDRSFVVGGEGCANRGAARKVPDRGAEIAIFKPFRRAG